MNRKSVMKIISDLVSMDAESYAQCKFALLTQVENKGFLHALFKITDTQRTFPTAMRIER